MRVLGMRRRVPRRSRESRIRNQAHASPKWSTDEFMVLKPSSHPYHPVSSAGSLFPLLSSIPISHSPLLPSLSLSLSPLFPYPFHSPLTPSSKPAPIRTLPSPTARKLMLLALPWGNHGGRHHPLFHVLKEGSLDQGVEARDGGRLREGMEVGMGM